MSVGFNIYYNTREHILSYHNKFKDPLCEQGGFMAQSR
jgi:hypothetical protein